MRINKDYQTQLQYLTQERAYIVKQLDNFTTYQLLSSEVHKIYQKLYATSSEEQEEMLEHLGKFKLKTQTQIQAILCKRIA